MSNITPTTSIEVRRRGSEITVIVHVLVTSGNGNIK